VLVTSELETDRGIIRRGLTVSSFTTICLTPSPFICFSTRGTSRAADLINRRQLFTVHILPSTPDAAKIAECFSKSDLAPHAGVHFQNPFELGHWKSKDNWPLPILDGSIGALLCKMDKSVNVGDHKLWIAQVQDVIIDDCDGMALGYCDRKYRQMGETVMPHDGSDE
jgi:flavin reductase (DIM6/NTAB) family NADH-FMN oxidoreductase RutF